ncbi:MAG: hypothetical protein HY841_08825 [Bacteroidetes bacterium]|nr:hypothetical protein [Bacteroidota bacterium]
MITKPHHSRTRKNTSLWAYLDSIGILENGTDEEIKKAKREYKKKYIFQYKRNQRSSHAEFSILLSKRNGEYGKVKSAAENHKMTMTAFLKASAFAYLNKQYLVPDKQQVARIEQFLIQISNEIQRIARREKDKRYEQVQQLVFVIQKEISETLRNPPCAKEIINP